jgi:Domain of unknown function (DUF4124)
MNTKASILRILGLALLVASLSPLAQAQWSWKDKSGNRVFSDQPPPSSIPDKDILKRPAGARAANTSAAPAAPQITATLDPAATAKPPQGAASAAATGASGAKAGADPELEKRKKAEEAAQAAKKKAEEEKIAAARKENCERARKGKADFDSGRRIGTTNAKGETEFISDAARAQETKRLQEIISSDCK